MDLCIYVLLSESTGCCFGKTRFGKTRSGTERESLGTRTQKRKEEKPPERENQQSLLKVLVAIASFSLWLVTPRSM